MSMFESNQNSVGIAKKTVLRLAISLSIIGGLLSPLPVSAQMLEKKGAPSLAPLESSNTLPVRGQISISREVNIAPAAKKVSLNMREASIRDILNVLAKQGGFNLILDESIEGTLTVDINNMSINKALEYIFTVSNFAFTKDGNTLIVASQDSAGEKNLTAQTFKAIPVQYKSAAQLATTLNSTLFSINRPNGQKTAVVAYDGETNSLLVMGTETDLKLVADYLREMDVPRNRRSYAIRHNTPNYVAQVISAHLFTPALSGSFGVGGGAAGGQAGGAAAGGQAGGQAGGAAAGGQAGGQAGGAAAGGQAGGAAAGGQAGAGGSTQALSEGVAPQVYNNGGVTLIADAVSSTLTALGTEEQLNMIEGIIEQIDVRRPQVAIEMALVEISSTDTRSLFPVSGTMQFGSFQLSLPNSLSGGTALAFRTNPTSSFPGAPTGSALPFDNFTIRNINTQRKVKVLANPTVVAMDGQESSITVTDQVATINETVVNGAGAATTTATITTTPVGITLAVTPHIFNDGSVELSLTPSVSSPGELVTAGGDSIAQTRLISTRSMEINGVRVLDSQTLILGGLLNNNQSHNTNKPPLLGSIPLIGGLFTQNDKQDVKTELVILITPHILKDDGVTYFSDPPQSQSRMNNTNQGRIQPVGLPKFTQQDQQRNLDEEKSLRWNQTIPNQSGANPSDPATQQSATLNRKMQSAYGKTQHALIDSALIVEPEEQPAPRSAQATRKPVKQLANLSKNGSSRLRLEPETETQTNLMLEEAHRKEVPKRLPAIDSSLYAPVPSNELQSLDEVIK